MWGCLFLLNKLNYRGIIFWGDNMKFDVPVPCFFGKYDFCEAIREIGKAGFDAAETYDWKSLDLEKVKNTCDETGVKLISMCTSDFNLTCPENRDYWLKCLDESCQAANKVGAEMLITQVGADTMKERQYQHESIVKGLTQAKPILEKYGVTLMIEPLNTLVDHKGYYLTSSSEAFDIIRETDSPFVKVVFDIYHQQISEGNIIPNIIGNLDLIAHLHCAGHPGRHELQLGENNYKFIFDTVDKAGYKGYCGLEYSPTVDAKESLAKFRTDYL